MTAERITKVLVRFFLVCLILVLVVEAALYLRPLPTLQPMVTLKSPTPESAVSLPWPNYGQAAIGAGGFGVLETHGLQKAAPIASVAKIMTAYSVLKEKPLVLGQQGPLITITDQDVTTYNDYYSKGGSVTKVVAGEQISEYQALQALLLPSANNFADTLAIWAFGSLDQYIVYANSQTKTLGLSNTQVADASGFSPQTVSTAQDLVVLGETAIKNPVIAQIVNQQQADLPVAGIVHNVNWLLGADSVNGIKTGDTDQAGGCFLFSSQTVIDNQKITIVGAIMSAPQLNNAIADSEPILNAAVLDFRTVVSVKAGQVVGYYALPWGDQTQVVASKDLSIFGWKDQPIKVSANLGALHAPASKGATVGTITVNEGQASIASDAVLSQKIATPSWRWRTFDR